MFDGLVHAGDQSNIPNLIDGATASGNSSPQLEIQQFSTRARRRIRSAADLSRMLS